MKGKIPETSEMILESGEDQWRLLINGLVNNLRTSAIIKTPDKKVRVKLEIDTIIPPEHSKTMVRTTIQANLEQDVSSGMERIVNLVSKRMEAEKWIFIGNIISENNVPIVIIYYRLIDIFVYSQKLKNENNQDFLPNFLNN